jgi:hydrogenase-4 component E
MNSWVDLIIISIVLMNLMMLSSNSMRTCIRIVAIQGVFVGLVPTLADSQFLALGTLISSVVSIVLKGIVFPWLLFRAQRAANIRKEVEPIGGYPLSLLVGVGLFLISFWLSARLPYTQPLFSDIVVPVSFATFFTGAFLIVSRVKALTQVLGYIVLENGVFLFGAALLAEQSLLVELAIMLDIFVAVFVMGIAIFHISREFDHIDTNDLSELKDWKS